MKHLFFGMAAVVTACVCAADKTGLSTIERYGGMVEVPAQGRVALVSYQTALTERDVRGFFLISDKVFELAYGWFARSGSFSVDKADAALAETGANAAVFFVNDPALPMTLVALEGKWALVNLAKVSEDSPKTLKLGQRVEKLFTRVMTQLMGGGMSQETPFSAMKPVFTVQQLDAQWGKAVSPAHLQQMSQYIRELGLQHPMQMPYYQACIMNLAPMPTNDIQKAIWDKVHSIPDKPMKITFDPAAQKGKVTK